MELGLKAKFEYLEKCGKEISISVSCGYAWTPGDYFALDGEIFVIKKVHHTNGDTVLTASPETVRDYAKRIAFGVPYGHSIPLKRRPSHDWNW